MQIEERIVGDVTILDLKGKMTLGEGDELLKDKINSLIHQGQKNLLLNLEGVPYIDSAGLGEIVRTYTTVSRQGGALKLVNLTKRITDLLSITKLLTVFETFDLEKDAVASFQSRRKPDPASRCRGAECFPEHRGDRGAGRPIRPVGRAEPAHLAAAGPVDEEPVRLRGPGLRQTPPRSGRGAACRRGIRDLLRPLRRGVPPQRRCRPRDRRAAPIEVPAADRVRRPVAVAPRSRRPP